MVERLAGEAWETKPRPERLLAVGQMFLADVLYLFLYLRREAIGREVRTDVACGACRRSFPFEADLDTLEVETAGTEDPADLVQEVTLADGIPVRGEVRKVLRVRPIRWCVMEGLGKGGVNEGAMKLAMFRDAIVGAEGMDTERTYRENRGPLPGRLALKVLRCCVGSGRLFRGGRFSPPKPSTRMRGMLLPSRRSMAWSARRSSWQTKV